MCNAAHWLNCLDDLSLILCTAPVFVSDFWYVQYSEGMAYCGKISYTQPYVDKETPVLD